jgi:hypothetical protein
MNAIIQALKLYGVNIHVEPTDENKMQLKKDFNAIKELANSFLNISRLHDLHDWQDATQLKILKL